MCLRSVERLPAFGSLQPQTLHWPLARQGDPYGAHRPSRRSRSARQSRDPLSCVKYLTRFSRLEVLLVVV